ncbi:restriction endonuclease subunit S [Sorangium sp. So ce363]|uniref:restriction endonuclease subunit S n=1 Tax=Sorangium sp. So ce363 TaxID=3133304 RepID=UPI003F6358D5
MQRGYLDLAEVKEIEASVAEIDELRLVPGDVLFNEGGDRDKLGRGWIWNGELPLCIHQNHVFRARICFGVLHPKLLSWYANTLGQKYFLEHGKQTTNLASINMTKLGALPVPIPPLREQARILEEAEKYLSDIDAGAASLERILANLKRYRASVLKAACEGRLVPTEAELATKEGREYEPGDVLLRRILEERRARWEADQLANMKAKGQVPRDDRWKAKYEDPQEPDTSKLPSLPAGWAWTTVRQLAFVASGSTPKGIDSSISSEGDIPWFRVSDMNLLGNEREMRTGSSYVSRRSSVELGLRIFRVGSIVFPKRGGAIATNKKRCLVGEAALDLNIMAVEPVAIAKNWLVAWFQRLDLSSIADGSNVPQINHGDVEPLNVPLPPLAEQLRIVAEIDRHLSVADETERVVRAQLARAQRLRQSVLKRAFEGKLVPQDPNDEPASVLLERIHSDQMTTERKKPRRQATRRHASDTEVEP